MKIAVLGNGTVGNGVLDIIEQQMKPACKDIEIAYLLIREGKPKTKPIMCDDINTILQDTSVDLVVEVMGGIEPAHTYILQALRMKKHVVSANKAVIAKYMKEFQECADENNVCFLYEASCGGGIPWLHNLFQSKRIDNIHEISGIFNGTTNYILDHMTKEQKQFDVILRRAQELGYAEKDPSADIDGIDIQNKLKISASIAFDSDIVQDFPTFGIRTIHKNDIAYFTSLHKCVKLMAVAKKQDDRYGAAVEPLLYDADAMESSISENFNLACLNGTTIGDCKFYGQGAGKLPTANAVVQDIIDILYQLPKPEISLSKNLRHDTSLVKGVYIVRTNNKECRQILEDFYDREERFQGYSYIWTKCISAYQMHQFIKQIMDKDAGAFMARIHEVTK